MAEELNATDLRKLVENSNVAIGTDSTLKNLKLGKVTQVILSANCPAKVEEDIEYYAGLSKAKTTKVSASNEELGVICKKTFSISVLSVLK